MLTRLILHPSMKRFSEYVCCELERNDVFKYIKFHLVNERGHHIGGCNVFAISSGGLEQFSGIGNDDIEIDGNGRLMIVGVDIL